MLPADVEGDPTERTPADNQTVRNVFVIGPDKKIKLILVYPMTTGRNFDEVLRVIDSLQLTAKHKVATPVNWQPGEDVIIAGSVSDDEAREKYPDGWESPKPYIRIVPRRTETSSRPAQHARGGRSVVLVPVAQGVALQQREQVGVVGGPEHGRSAGADAPSPARRQPVCCWLGGAAGRARAAGGPVRHAHRPDRQR